MASGVESAILALCRQNNEGITDQIMNTELPQFSLEDRVNAINSLLQKQAVQIFQKGGVLIYKEQDQQQSAKLRGLSSEDLLLYQIIQQSGTMGIWTKDMKMKSNLQQPQITKILKTLEGRKLIKAVKSVASKNRKVYMLFELEPSREVTGGAWYSDQEFDSEFIGVLRDQCLQYVLNEAPVMLEDIADRVRRSGITKEDLRLEDYTQVMNTLVFDGEIEVFVSTGTGKESRYPSGTELFRPAKHRIPESSVLTNIPCGICPVHQDCTDDGLVSPKTCVYFQEWLQF